MVDIQLAVFQVNQEATVARSVIYPRQGTPMAQLHRHPRDMAQICRCSRRRLALVGAGLGIILWPEPPVAVELHLRFLMGPLLVLALIRAREDRGMKSINILAFGKAPQRRLLTRARRNPRITSHPLVQSFPEESLSHLPWTLRQQKDSLS